MITKEKPPQWILDKCEEMFGATWEQNISWTYGTQIHYKGTMQADLYVHEMKHVEQQTKMGADEWWNRYFADQDFRLSQELEAYRAQYKYICTIVKDRNARSSIAREYAKALASPMYGNMLTTQEALQKITRSVL